MNAGRSPSLPAKAVSGFWIAILLLCFTLANAHARIVAPTDTIPTSPQETCVWGFSAHGSGQHPVAALRSLGIATGSDEFAYETASGRPIWPNRDPIGEEGGHNLYALGHNDALNRIDPLGHYDYDPKARTSTVGKCEILIVYGHGSGKQPFKFKLPSTCGGSVGVATCFTYKQLSDVDEGHILPGQKPIGIQIIWNAPQKGLIRDRLESDQGEGVMPGNGDAVLASLEGSVALRAKEMCESCRCKSIAVRYFRNAKDSEKDIPKRNDATINCKDLK